MIHPFDLMAIFLLGAFGYVGYRRGFVDEMGRLAGLILASVVAFQYHDAIAVSLFPRLPLDGRLLIVGSFGVLFVITLMAARIVTRFLQMFLLARGIRWANRTMGIAIGALKASVVAIILCWAVDILPNADYFAEMKTRSTLYRNSSDARNWIIDAFHLEDSIQNSEMWVKEKMRAK